MFWNRKSKKTGKVVTKTSSQAKIEEEERQRKYKEERTCPECLYDANLSLILNVRDVGTFSLYSCRKCKCEWEVPL